MTEPSRNRYRAKKDDLSKLEKKLSFKERFFSVVALKRGARRLKVGLVIALILSAIGALIWWGTSSILEKAYSLHIDKIEFKARNGIMSKDQAMEILELHGAVNLATVNPSALEDKLMAHPLITHASVHAELPDTLSIEVDERIPIVYIERQDGALTGKRDHLFMDPTGMLFQINDEYHRNFLAVPTYYVDETVIPSISPGTVMAEHNVEPIRALIAASNRYDADRLPRIREIFRPKAWKLLIVLETGVEVEMQVYDSLDAQVDRLVMILDHARATNRTLLRANVIQELNPSAVFRETLQKEAEKKNK